MKNLFLFFSALLFVGSAAAQNILAAAELEAQNISKVKIRGSFVDVEVTEGNKVYFEGVIRGNGDKGDYKFITNIEGDALVIEVKSNTNSWSSSRTRDSYIKLQITKGVELDIDNSSGDIEINYLDAAESKIGASSGDVTLLGVVSDLEIRTSSGDIVAKNVKGDLSVRTTSGDHEYYDVTGDLAIVATSGDIFVEDFNGKLTLESTSGDVELEEANGEFEIRSTSGSIEGYNVLLKGDAFFKASSGDIEIDFENDLDDLSFDLSSSSGDIKVGSDSADKKLKISRGGYEVTGITSSGEQRYTD